MHLDDGFPNQSCSKEGPERNQEMAAGYSSQVEERIRNLKTGTLDITDSSSGHEHQFVRNKLSLKVKKDNKIIKRA